MGKRILEACVDSVESAMIATKAGASRLELCANLVIGGTTPTLAQFQEVKKNCDLPIHILIRPRFGDFLYSHYEFEVIKEEILRFQEAGADGIVIGILKEDGTLDAKRLSKLISLSGNLHLTLHRAFDLCRSSHKALEEAIDLGFHTILTSGQASDALRGLDVLASLQEAARDRIDLMAGSGVNAETISAIYKATKITSYHMSGKVIKESGMKYRKEGVNMGLPSISEYSIWQTEEASIREAIFTLKSLIND